MPRSSPAPYPAPRVTGILETCLYVADVEAAARFYESLFGFPRLASDARFCAFAVTGRAASANRNTNVLLLFRHGATREPIALAGGIIPPHNGSGEEHLAFAVPAEDLAAWENRLASLGIVIESRVRWELGGESVYFRDPDRHLVELATPGTWPTY
jgi:catechol 2,3-dioxygenase-like lactoylglutathione lyase family enzyme